MYYFLIMIAVEYEIRIKKSFFNLIGLIFHFFSGFDVVTSFIRETDWITKEIPKNFHAQI